MLFAMRSLPAFPTCNIFDGSVAPIPTFPDFVIIILRDELFAPEDVLNCKSLASPVYVVDVILLRVAVLYVGIPNSIPDT
jgi:hypothetical protein